MSIFRRLSATMTARVDEAVRGIENHDAVVGVSLEDLRRAIAETRVRQRRVQASIDRQTRERGELVGAAARWRERAGVAGTDEDTALECLRRARGHDRRIEGLDRELAGQRAALSKLARALERLERRQHELASQRETLRGREAAARAHRSAAAATPRDDDALRATLERWDIDVTTDELAVADEPGEDDLAERFEAAEEEQALRAELAALRGGNRGE